MSFSRGFNGTSAPFKLRWDQIYAQHFAPSSVALPWSLLRASGVNAYFIHCFSLEFLRQPDQGLVPAAAAATTAAATATAATAAGATATLLGAWGSPAACQVKWFHRQAKPSEGAAAGLAGVLESRCRYEDKPSQPIIGSIRVAFHIRT